MASNPGGDHTKKPVMQDAEKKVQYCHSHYNILQLLHKNVNYDEPRDIVSPFRRRRTDNSHNIMKEEMQSSPSPSHTIMHDNTLLTT